MFEFKSSLAKLLAIENISVQHDPNAQTAAFDVKNRTLHLPVWKNISEDLFDMLVVHEVGHALDTPCEAWLKAIADIGTKSYGDPKKAEGSVKQFLNIVEDARIDKRQKRRYPGSKRNYVAGLKELHDRDFFGLSGKDINKMVFIDRANIYYKGGVGLGIQFKNDKERDFIKRMNETETFDEVVALTTEIFEYAKNEEEIEPKSEVEVEVEVEFDENGDGEYGDEFGSDDRKTENEVKKNNSNQNSTEADSKDKGVGAGEVPVSATEKAFEKNSQSIVSKIGSSYIYISLPEPSSIKNMIDDYKIVIPEMMLSVNPSHNHSYHATNVAQVKTELNEWRKEEQNIISYMVKEFEIRKAAETYARISVAKTGVIDTNKLHSYQYNEDIFRRQTTMPTGKNHGFVMILDWSGSMSYNLKNTLKQLFSLVLFCKRMQIPFEVYLFKTKSTSSKQFKTKSTKPTYSFGGVSLRNILSSRMNTTTLNNAMECLFYASYYGVDSDRLGGTPLNQAILATEMIINDFKKKSKVQIVNTIILTDGASDTSYLDMNGNHQPPNGPYEYFIQDEKTKMTYSLGGNYSNYTLTNSIIDAVKQRTGCNMIGFFLHSGPIQSLGYMLIDKYSKPIQVTKKMNEDWQSKGFVTIQNAGYDEYYLLNVDVTSSKTNAGVFKKNMNKKEIYDTFSRNLQKKKFSREMLNKFIDRVARERF